MRGLQLKDGLNLDIVLVYPLGHKMPRTFFFNLPTRMAGAADGYGADSPGGKAQHRAGVWTDAGSPGRLQMGLDRDRHTLDWALHAQR